MTISVASDGVDRLLHVHPFGTSAIDPTSPLSGGALLGDRLRMQTHTTDPNVFIRSMASRGHLGGMALAAPEAIRVLDAAGHDVVIVETVGVGQAEVDVAAATDTTLVVVSPGWGDAVQVAKAGILEIADVFVVNKGDREGAEVAARDLRQMLKMGPELPWTPPIVTTTAIDGAGIAELWDAIEAHRAYLDSSGDLERGRAVNPLAPGRLTPYRDTTVPRVLAITIVRGVFVAEAIDMPSLPVPGRWHGFPVTPALVSWHTESESGHVVAGPRIALVMMPQPQPDQDRRGGEQQGQRQPCGEGQPRVHAVTPEVVSRTSRPSRSTNKARSVSGR